MRITSQAGDFVVDIQSMQVEGDKLVMIGKMGWWDSKLYFGSTEMLTMLGMMLVRPRVLLFLVILPFRVLFRVLTGRIDEEEDWVEPEYIGGDTGSVAGSSPDDGASLQAVEDEDSEYAPD